MAADPATKCVVSFFVMVIWLAASLAMYLTGCDATLQPNCEEYDIRKAKTVGYVVSSVACAGVVSSEVDDDSSANPSSSCYSAWAKLAYSVGPLNGTCLFDAVDLAQSQADAVAQAQNRFPLGSSRSVYIRDSKCYSKVDSGYALAVAGIVGFCITFCALCNCMCTSTLLVMATKEEQTRRAEMLRAQAALRTLNGLVESMRPGAV
jgi:hypothetical protein